MGLIYDVCCKDSREEELAEDYMEEHDIFDWPDYVSKTFQWVLVILTGVEFFFGTAITIFGIFMLVIRTEYGYSSQVQDQFIKLLYTIPVLMLILGILILIFSFVGGIGAMREHVPTMTVYAVFLFLLTCLQLISVVLLAIFRTDLLATLDKYLRSDAIAHYRDDVDLQNLWDIFQGHYKCCGASPDSYLDWSANAYFNCTSSNPSFERCGVPATCCRQDNKLDAETINTQCGANVQNMKLKDAEVLVFSTGCMQVVDEKISEHASKAIIILIIFIVIPVIQNVMIIILIKDVNAEHRAYEMMMAEKRGLRPQANGAAGGGGGEGVRERVPNERDPEKPVGLTESSLVNLPPVEVRGLDARPSTSTADAPPE